MFFHFTEMKDTSYLRRITGWSIRIPEWSIRIPEWSIRIPEWNIRIPEWSIRIPEWSIRIPEWSIRITEWSSRITGRSRRVFKKLVNCRKACDIIVSPRPFAIVNKAVFQALVFHHSKAFATDTVTTRKKFRRMVSVVSLLTSAARLKGRWRLNVQYRNVNDKIEYRFP